jgi:hypothetical protein
MFPSPGKVREKNVLFGPLELTPVTGRKEIRFDLWFLEYRTDKVHKFIDSQMNPFQAHPYCFL